VVTLKFDAPAVKVSIRHAIDEMKNLRLLFARQVLEPNSRERIILDSAPARFDQVLIQQQGSCLAGRCRRVFCQHIQGEPDEYLRWMPEQ
jgi:hypothetical protein